MTTFVDAHRIACLLFGIPRRREQIVSRQISKCAANIAFDCSGDGGTVRIPTSQLNSVEKIAAFGQAMYEILQPLKKMPIADVDEKIQMRAPMVFKELFGAPTSISVAAKRTSALSGPLRGVTAVNPQTIMSIYRAAIAIHTSTNDADPLEEGLASDSEE